MTSAMRKPTLQTIGLGSVIDVFHQGRLPVDTAELVDTVFGKSDERGSLVISGANGIVGAGKTMQLGARLQPFDIPIVALDFPSAPDPGLVAAFGEERADAIMGNVVRLTYDGVHLPAELTHFRPRFLLEAIPEVLDVKRAHYEVFRQAFPEVQIRSVTSGFPSSELGVGVFHPAFPHEVNKMWEVVEPEPSPITQLFWALGLIPVPVSDHWSFVLDVLFCGSVLAGLRYHRALNMPPWKIDKLTRKLLGPNPFRASDAIGARAANYLIWSCLHHLSESYGDLFEPTPELVEHKETGADWYPPNHFRPLVDWKLDDAEAAVFRTWILGALFQMTSLMVHERRGHLAHINMIGETCAQFRRGMLAVMREVGPDSAIQTVEAYHRVHPEAGLAAWHPEAFEQMEGPEWQQLYVNAEHHLSTQMIGADISEFFPAVESVDEGVRLSTEWSRTARRLGEEFSVSVGVVAGKRCMGGFLELLVHCRYLVAEEDAQLGLPEVTLPVVPGMEGCHWMFRKARPEDWPKLLQLLLGGRPVKARSAEGWLVDFAAPLGVAIQKAWQIVTGGDHGLLARELDTGSLSELPHDYGVLPPADAPVTDAARRAIMACVTDSCGCDLSEALAVQARHAAEFLASPACRTGRVGSEFTRTMSV
jgi:enoyl-CoA hydratase/carnithine racemase/3-hydroxyacyl-CoA dehydrogenase